MNSRDKRLDEGVAALLTRLGPLERGSKTFDCHTRVSDLRLSHTQVSATKKFDGMSHTGLADLRLSHTGLADLNLTCIGSSATLRLRLMRFDSIPSHFVKFSPCPGVFFSFEN